MKSGTIAVISFTLIIIFNVFVVSCDLDQDQEGTVSAKTGPNIETLADSQFNGKFWHDGTGTAYQCYTFDGTNKVRYSWNTYHYIYDIKSYTYQWEIDVPNGKYRYSIWGAENNWSAWLSYSFNADGTELTLEDAMTSSSGTHFIIKYTKR